MTYQSPTYPPSGNPSEISYDEALAAIQSYQDANQIELGEEIHGINFTFEDDQPIILELHINPPRGTLAGTFHYEFPVGAPHDVPFRRIQAPYAELNAGPGPGPIIPSLATGAVQVGTAAVGAGMAPSASGTVGWNLWLNGLPTCMSCMHVLCASGNSTPIGSACELDGRSNATLQWFQPVVTGGQPNTWDMALATYRNSADMLGQFRPCQSPLPTPPLPTLFSPNPGLVPARIRCYKVGMGTPRCNDTGYITGVANRSVPWGSKYATFTGQLLVSADFAGPHDSGAIVVRSDTNRIIGLHFASTPHVECLANPLFNLGPIWTFHGVVGTLPIYTT